MITPKDDPIVQEISDVLREWSFVWKRLYAVSLIGVKYMQTTLVYTMGTENDTHEQ